MVLEGFAWVAWRLSLRHPGDPLIICCHDEPLLAVIPFGLESIRSHKHKFRVYGSRILCKWDDLILADISGRF